jgi:hypothetical protein
VVAQARRVCLDSPTGLFRAGCLLWRSSSGGLVVDLDRREVPPNSLRSKEDLAKPLKSRVLSHVRLSSSRRKESSWPGLAGRVVLAGRRAWQEAERKTTVDHTLMRGLVTAGPSIRLGAASVFLRASTWSAAKGPSRVPWKLCLRRCASATWTYLRSRLPGCGPCSTESDRVTTVRRVGRGGR